MSHLTRLKWTLPAQSAAATVLRVAIRPLTRLRDLDITFNASGLAWDDVSACLGALPDLEHVDLGSWQSSQAWRPQTATQWKAGAQACPALLRGWGEQLRFPSLRLLGTADAAFVPFFVGHVKGIRVETLGDLDDSFATACQRLSDCSNVVRARIAQLEHPNTVRLFTRHLLQGVTTLWLDGAECQHALDVLDNRYLPLLTSLNLRISTGLHPQRTLEQLCRAARHLERLDVQVHANGADDTGANAWYRSPWRSLDELRAAAGGALARLNAYEIDQPPYHYEW